MTTKRIVEVRALSTAEDLFREVSPATSDLWRVDNHISQINPLWIFRGQGNGADGVRWGLLPTAHRSRNAFVPGPTAPTLSGKLLRDEELGHVLAFAEIVDHHGMIVPGDRHEMRDSRLRAPSPPSSLFPRPELVAMFALAQHHGIPTRLLDWTWKPLVAAYFAAEPVARRRRLGSTAPASECDFFSVYALRRGALPVLAGLDPEIHMLSVPTATNAKLHAQGGVFSLVQPLSDHDAPLPAIDDVLRKHEDAILGREPKFGDLFPFLVEFRVPSREARATMLTLRFMEMTGATVYPDLDGVAKAMDERWQYDWAPVGSRS